MSLANLNSNLNVEVGNISCENVIFPDGSSLNYEKIQEIASFDSANNVYNVPINIELNITKISNQVTIEIDKMENTSKNNVVDKKIIKDVNLPEHLRPKNKVVAAMQGLNNGNQRLSCVEIHSDGEFRIYYDLTHTDFFPSNVLTGFNGGTISYFTNSP